MSRRCKMTQLISPFLDGELSEKKTAYVRQHLTNCNECQKELELLRSVDHMLLGVKEIKPSDEFSRTFWQKADELAAQQSNRTFQKFAYWGLRPSLIAAAAGLLIVSSVLLVQKYHPPKVDSSGILIAENLEFYSDLEIIDRLELLENWDEITAMDDI